MSRPPSSLDWLNPIVTLVFVDLRYLRFYGLDGTDAATMYPLSDHSLGPLMFQTLYLNW
jgi:hypothetical protein